MAGRQHLHKYKLKILGKPSQGPDWSKPGPGKYLIYACELPECTHYVEARMAIGKASICWVCGEKCIIPPLNNQGKFRVRPHCEQCTRVYPGTKREELKRAGLDDKLKSVSLEDLLGGVNLDDMFDTEE